MAGAGKVYGKFLTMSQPSSLAASVWPRRTRHVDRGRSLTGCRCESVTCFKRVGESNRLVLRISTVLPTQSSSTCNYVAIHRTVDCSSRCNDGVVGEGGNIDEHLVRVLAVDANTAAEQEVLWP